MFFHHDYATPGPGLDPNAPEKTGWARLFQILQLECFSLFKLNVLFLLCCLPVVTIPPALYAMNQVVRRMILDQPVDCWYHFRTAFRQNWKRSYPAFLLVAVPLVGSLWGANVYLALAQTQVLAFLPFMLCSTVFLVALLASPYFYGVLSTGAKVLPSLVLGLRLGLGKPLRAILAVLCVYGLSLLAVLEFPLSLAYLLLLGFSVPCLLGNFFIRTVLKRYAPAPAGLTPAPEGEQT